MMKKCFVKKIYRKLLNRIFNPFFDFNLKPVPLEFKNGERCLLIAPHPDDESIGCGGLLNLEGQRFDVVCLTNAGTEREIEFSSAMNFAGVKNFKILNLKDKQISSQFQLFKNIEIINYDYIFIPYIFDQHRDHKAVSLLLQKLLSKTRHKPELKIAFYEVWSAINMPQYYIDISTVIDKKKEMINLHKSQVLSKNYAGKISGLNSYRGLIRNLDYAECFCVLNCDDFLKYVKNIIFDEGDFES